jgi:transglutaminase-like putative cysteine protease
MMEAVRSVGLAARFVSGYLYDSALVDASSGLVGGGATHAWLEIFIPGTGWIEFDPTNALVGGRNLIRVAVTRDPRQAIPLQGSYVGPPDAFIAMDVEVAVTTE